MFTSTEIFMPKNKIKIRVSGWMPGEVRSESSQNKQQKRTWEKTRTTVDESVTTSRYKEKLKKNFFLNVSKWYQYLYRKLHIEWIYNLYSCWKMFLEFARWLNGIICGFKMWQPAQ
jgi:hypothetical protein